MDRRELIDERIRILLTSTDLTFKQIIEQLRNENMPASFNTIRRVNRNHRYRKPRYDAKLTLHQRRELIIKLKNTTRPNLSSLARQYGVCHGSIWYWWDKLSKIREKNGGQIPSNEPTLEFDDLIEQDFMSPGGGGGSDEHRSPSDDYLAGDPDSDPLDLTDDDSFETNNNNNHLHYDYDNPNGINLINNGNSGTEASNFFKQDANSVEEHQQSAKVIGQSNLVGPVQAKNTRGEFIRLPIIMYAATNQTILSNWNIANTKAISTKASSSSTSSAASNYKPTGPLSLAHAGSLSKRLGVS